MPDIWLQHMLAVMLVDRTVSFRAAHDAARMQDPAVREQRAKIRYVPDAELAALLPVRVAVVEVSLRDGTRLTRARRGGARHGPQSNGPRRGRGKARDLIAPVLR